MARALCRAPHLEPELAAAVRELGAGAKVAFLSTPSIYFSLSPKERETSFIFDVRL